MSSLALPGMMDIPFLPLGRAFTLPSAPPPAPTPLPWTPKYQPEQWVSTDGSDIKSQPRLGAAMVHVPTCTTIYIIVIGDTDEARTIMRAEPVAVYTALDKFATHEWMEICTDTLSSLYTILHYYRKLETRGPQYYHHHLLLLSRIADLLEKRRRQGFITSLHTFWAHANIRDNDLADATAKMAVTQYDFLPE